MRRQERGYLFTPVKRYFTINKCIYTAAGGWDCGVQKYIGHI